MNAFRVTFCAATLFALVAGFEVNAQQAFCLKNHYILDYPCDTPAGTPPPAFQIPPYPPGANHWIPIGPDGANVVALAIDPVAPTTAFAGTTGSGVLKTTDGGASWTIVNTGLPTTNVLVLAIDPITHSTLYAGTDVGVFKSINGGQSWSAANAGLGGAAQIVVNALAIDPASPATLYAGTANGAFKTTNGAASWTSINAGLSGLAARVIAVDPTAPSTVYVTVDDIVNYVDNGVFKSTDGGTSWAKIYSTPLTDEDGAPPITALAIDPHSPSRLYLVIALSGLVTSPDGGNTWSDIAAPADDVWSLTVDAASSGTIYVGSYGGSIFRSTDAGNHWLVSAGLQASSVTVIATAASAPGTVFAGAQNGVFRSSDSAQTWTHPALGVRNLGVFPLAVDPSASSTIYSAVGGVLEKTTDGGVHWAVSNTGLPDRWTNRLAIDPLSPSTLYAVWSTPFVGGSVVYKSTDAGAHWATPSNVTFPTMIQPLAIAPTQPSTLYVGVNFRGVVKSTDGGASWATASNGLNAVGPFVSALAVDPTTADTVYAATDPTGQPDTPAKIFKSTDGAAHWLEVPIGLPISMIITSMVIDSAAPSIIYAPYTDYGGQGGVLKSTDSGETWVDTSQNLPARSIQVLVVGAGSQVYVATDIGVFSSADGARTWTPLNVGLPSVGVSDLAIDHTGSLLLATTIGGLFEYDLSRLSSSAPVLLIEYYHAGLDHYFITATPDEITGLDSGAIPGWTRTGFQFNALAAQTIGTSPVCRFYSTAFGQKSSHFYSPFVFECSAAQANSDWSLETGAAFYIAIPADDGSCAPGLVPIYRLYNSGQGGAPNHRYTTDLTVRAQMMAQGWTPEGFGPDAVQMCSSP